MTAVARWKELCMDTSGGERLGRFWAEVAGLEFRPDRESGNVVGPTEGHGIAMCRVPEPKTVKHRVHLDVHTGSVDDLVASGATVVRRPEESGLSWTVMADPEGGEFCAFLRDPAELPEYRIYELCVDALDAELVARWWGDVLGAEPRTSGHGDWWWLEGVPGLSFESIVFNPVPEPKTVKNRIHWDVVSTVDAMRGKGATLLRARDEEISWDVMADPEGNEFCVFER
ncbi:MAG TPA: VOC family protein [Nocardioidaceae bacterium]|nr:VOC family protein [Nocardioidaceae bacterium]